MISDESEMEWEVVVAKIPTCRGMSIQFLDVAICRAQTKRRDPGQHVLEELRVAHLSDLVRKR